VPVSYLVVKWLHVLSSTLLFGTGLGSMFYMYFVSRTRDPKTIAVVARHVVIADWVFTTPAAILQPLTGWYLMHLAGFPFTTAWIAWSLALYVLAGAAWLPVLWMQVRMRDLAIAAAASNRPLPERFSRYLRVWTALGVVAFGALIVVFYLMVAKPLASNTGWATSEDGGSADRLGPRRGSILAPWKPSPRSWPWC
jgi:uncharacterized membrane protein